MPTISVKRDVLFAALGKKYSDEEFQDLCFEFGLELDEVTTEKQMLMKEQGTHAGTGVSEEILYRIDIPANRYDLLCLEGLVNGILVFQGKKAPPQYKLTKHEDCHSLHLTSATSQIRPYAVAAVLKGVTFTKQSYDSFIDLQDKLHQNICRKRALVAIGTHDLDSIQGPFQYDALPPNEIKFKALNQEKEMTALELMELYSHHAQLKQYLPIIRDSPVYPVIKDKNGVVLSMPPIINGDHSKITLNTRNVFIEATATDLTKAIIVLDTIVCMFSQYCAKPYEVQQCKVFAPDGTYELYPKMEYREEYIDVNKANRYIGISEPEERVASLLSRMCLTAGAGEGGGLRVRVPPTRHDVIHACDLYEDIAIAYGYNNIERRTPAVTTSSAQEPLNKLTEQLRRECACAAYTEALTFTLCSRDDVSTKLGLKIEDVPAAHISNPKTLEFQVVRTTLVSGLLKTIAANKKMPLPLKLFELSDVVIMDPIAESGARNERRLCAVYCGKTAGFQFVHGLLDRVMALLRQPWAADGYTLKQSDDPAYFPGRCAEILLRGRVIGKLGVLHPQVLAAFDLANPCSALEFNIEPFL
ncbi:unnamed protein product [Diatraea saccharalis]|uniref:Phenylalanine--tRNA ligase beta subunit n=1 Tax=Diatraea saccharalis TaxID=40085 RepID=A0A9P0C8Z7_9NEOP|nr:unnamed protein product [Diatraea saccharalis]